MKLNQLFTDDEAVSPVIGVILMVAITVILAAVIASFVLGLGESTDTTPQVSWDFEYEQGITTSPTYDSFGNDASTYDGLLTITHDGGDSVDATALAVKGSSASASYDVVTDSSEDPQYSSSATLESGSSITVAANDGDTIRVVYEDPSGDSTNTLQKWTGPDA